MESHEVTVQALLEDWGGAVTRAQQPVAQRHLAAQPPGKGVEIEHRVVLVARGKSLHFGENVVALGDARSHPQGNTRLEDPVAVLEVVAQERVVGKTIARVRAEREQLGTPQQDDVLLSGKDRLLGR